MGSKFRMIEKFDDENYHPWKLKIKVILIDKGLYKEASGKHKIPSGDTPKEIEKWDDLDHRALFIICFHLKDAQLLSVSKAKSSEEAWASLEAIYEVKNIASLLHLLQRFFTIKMSEGDNIATHINKLRELTEQLASIREDISDLYFVMTLLRSLPESYQTLVVTLGTQDPKQLTLEMVTAMLMQEESRHRGSGSSSKAALMVTKRDKSHHNNHGDIKYSHGDSKGSHSDHKKNARYRYCGKKGHYEKECRVKERSVKSVLESNGTWFIDSGASTHDQTKAIVFKV